MGFANVPIQRLQKTITWLRALMEPSAVWQVTNWSPWGPSWLPPPHFLTYIILCVRWWWFFCSVAPPTSSPLSTLHISLSSFHLAAPLVLSRRPRSVKPSFRWLCSWLRSLLHYVCQVGTGGAAGRRLTPLCHSRSGSHQVGLQTSHFEAPFKRLWQTCMERNSELGKDGGCGRRENFSRDFTIEMKVTFFCCEIKNVAGL